MRRIETGTVVPGAFDFSKGLKPNPKKVDAVERCPTPTTVKEVESFLGLTGLLPQVRKGLRVDRETLVRT